jgi:hypothetical protein
MSKEEIPWDKVAKEIVKVLGTETARGLYYGFAINSLYPILAGIVRRAATSPSPSENEIRRMIREELGRVEETQTLLPSRLTTEELERRIAQMLRQYGSTVSAPSPSIQTQPFAPATAPPDVEFEIEQIKNRIRGYENTRNQLISKKYTSLNDEERRKIEESIKEIDAEIEKEKARLTTIRSTYKI